MIETEGDKGLTMLRVIKLIIISTQLSVITVTLDMSDRSLSLANEVLSSVTLIFCRDIRHRVALLSSKPVKYWTCQTQP